MIESLIKDDKQKTKLFEAMNNFLALKELIGQLNGLMTKIHRLL